MNELQHMNTAVSMTEKLWNQNFSNLEELRWCGSPVTSSQETPSINSVSSLLQSAKELSLADD